MRTVFETHGTNIRLWQQTTGTLKKKKSRTHRASLKNVSNVISPLCSLRLSFCNSFSSTLPGSVW